MLGGTSERLGEEARQGHLLISGELNVFTVVEQRERFLEALAGCATLNLDLSAVTELDGAGLQLLLALRREVVESGKRLALVAKSAEVDAVLEMCGLTRAFDAAANCDGDRPPEEC